MAMMPYMAMSCLHELPELAALLLGVELPPPAPVLLVILGQGVRGQGYREEPVANSAPGLVQVLLVDLVKAG